MKNISVDREARTLTYKFEDIHDLRAFHTLVGMYVGTPTAAERGTWRQRRGWLRRQRAKQRNAGGAVRTRSTAATRSAD